MSNSNDYSSPIQSDEEAAARAPDVTPLNSFDERILSISPPRLRSKRKSKQKRPDAVVESATTNVTAKICRGQRRTPPTLSSSGRFRMALYEAAIANSDGELAFSSEDEAFIAAGGVSAASGPLHSHRRDAKMTRARKQERDFKQGSGSVALDEFSITGTGGDDVTQDSDLETDSARRSSPPRARNSFSSRSASFKRISPNQRLSRRGSTVRSSGSSSVGVGGTGRMECTGERLRFHRDFTQLMRLALPARREKEAASRTQCTSSATTSVTAHHQENDTMQSIWFEIRCVLDECAWLPMQQRIMSARDMMPDVIEEITNFRVNAGEDDLFMPEQMLPVASMDGPTQDYVTRVRLALIQVDSLMTRLDTVCDAWPSLNALETDYPDFGRPMIIGRLKTLYLWKNITSDLNSCMKRIAKELGLHQRDMDAHWHFVDMERVFQRPPSYTTSNSAAVHSASDSELSDSQQPAKVTFTVDSDTSTPRSSSPANRPVASAEKFPDEIENVLRLYRSYADKSLKKVGISNLLTHMRDMLDKVLQTARRAMRRPSHFGYVTNSNSMRSSLDSYVDVVREGGGAEPLASSPSLIAFTEGSNPDDRRSSKTETMAAEELTMEMSAEEELMRHGVWSKDFDAMLLPSFLPTYVVIARIPLDALHACLRLRLQQMEKQGEKSAEPSFLSLGQLIRECKDVIRGAVLVKRYYKRMVSDVLNCDAVAEERLCEQNLEGFDRDVTRMLDVYFEFLQVWMTKLQTFQEASRSYKNILENEWVFIKRICHSIHGGEASAAKRFCNLGSILLNSIGDFLQKSIDNQLGDLFDRTHPMLTDSSDDDRVLDNDVPGEQSNHVSESETAAGTEEKPRRLLASDRNRSFDSVRHVVITSCKDVRQLFREARLRLAKAIGFAKMLRKDLEIAADFDFARTDSGDEADIRQRILDALNRSEHVRVRDVPGADANTVNFGVFVPKHISNKVDNILHVLRTICARDATALSFDDSHPGSPFEHVDLGYVLLVEGCAPRTGEDLWKGREVQLPPQCSAEHTVVMSHRDVSGILLVVASSTDLDRQRSRFLDKMGNLVILRNEYTACHQSIAEALSDLKQEAIALRGRVQDTIHELEEHLDSAAEDAPNEEHEHVLKTCRECLHFCYPLGFEYHKELIRLLTGVDMKRAFIPGLLEFAYQWMDFVQTKCETGRGTLPRWSNAGCDFMISLALPCLMTLYTEEQFQHLKRRISDCITHLIGKRTTSSSSASSSNHSGSQSHPYVMPSSPDSCPYLLDGVQRSNLTIHPSPARSTSMMDGRRKYSGQISFRSDPSSSPMVGAEMEPGPLTSQSSSATSVSMFGSSSSRRQRVMAQLKKLERRQNERLSNSRRIGRIMKETSFHLPHRMVRQVNFSWQRGVKLGAGQFGTVYTAVNLNTGDLMAMKEIRLQHNNHQSVRSLADEIDTFTRLRHACLVRYFGVEVHREEMLVFMEYCDGGTLQDAARQGLEESLIRRYTREIISGLHCLHENSIVHRDVKSANVFLCKKGPLKLGDFGSSVKLKSTTMSQPNELCDMVGTIHYMAPEIITRSGTEGGYGRRSDIWSLGCVVWEMLVGKRPWADAESEYQIMFKVGMGDRPVLPRTIQASDEALDFLNKCLVTDPAGRMLASELIDHPFAKVLEEEEDFSPPS